MKSLALRLSVVPMVVALSLLVLNGCATPEKTQMAEKPMEQDINYLSGPELTSLFAGATQREVHPKYNGEFHYAADGTIKGRTWGTWGERTDTGKWHVNDKGLLCQKFMGAFSQGGERCYSYSAGEGDNNYTRHLVTGSSSNNWPTGKTPVTISKE
ncbi:hypothetical protein [Desulfofustis limnaeus]|jgi:hypothetical protein|uniref:Uncharacterized protein n=1 Tax=Desulfofustis limnaeus TaxID=2740163 RepID=A0ABN6M4Z3_9BACT|nr:hypothetical protein [Desulfofustis limnaeus]BDD87964.1 hypothetical protein DPPLL_23290 [Desulfofustis limnaeus]